jgi:hypothetical protein
MKKKKIILFTLLISGLFLNANAQDVYSFYPFKGFHLGITGQAEYVQKCTFTYLTGSPLFVHYTEEFYVYLPQCN